jgi:Predicted integral membrane protein
MPVVDKTVHIEAPVEDVFDLITRVEEFPAYVSLLKEVRPIGKGTYHWCIELCGIRLAWDGVVTERIRPRRFAWKSCSGQPNSGAFTLQPEGEGTQVRFRMEYRFRDAWLERLLTPVLGYFLDKASDEALAHVKERLEGKDKGREEREA